MFKKLRDLDPEVHLIFLGAIVFLLVGYISLHQKYQKVSQEVDSLKENKTSSEEKTSESKITLDDVKNLIKQSLPGSSKTTVIKETTASGKNIVYTPVGTSFSSSSTSWVDIKSAEFYLDLENEYGKDAKVYFEASLKALDGHGEILARLFDVTHSIAVNTSDISIKDKGEFTYTFSPNLYLWRGRNLYRVQVKSPSGTEVSITNAKIKIVY